MCSCLGFWLVALFLRSLVVSFCYSFFFFISKLDHLISICDRIAEQFKHRSIYNVVTE